MTKKLKFNKLIFGITILECFGLIGVCFCKCTDQVLFLTLGITILAGTNGLLMTLTKSQDNLDSLIKTRINNLYKPEHHENIYKKSYEYSKAFDYDDPLNTGEFLETSISKSYKDGYNQCLRDVYNAITLEENTNGFIH